MGCLGNLIWMIFGGLISAISWFFIGCLWCLTIVGIPVGLQCFKIAKLSLMPFGKDVVREESGFGSLLWNILWLIFGGLELAVMHLFVGVILAITIIGIPLLVVLGIVYLVFVVLAAVKANNGEYWRYPFIIQFFKQ